MKIAIIVVGVLFALIAIVLIAGYSLPVKHTATLSRSYKTSPESLFAAIADIDGRKAWRTGLTAVEHVPSTDGKTRYCEIGSNGTIAYVVEALEPNRRLVTRIDDKSLPFGGTWTYEVTPEANGRATLRITEDGEVYNPIFRFVSRYIMGHEATMKTYLDDLSKRHLDS